MLLALTGLGGLGALVIVMSLLPLDTRRGLAAVVALVALVSGATATAPGTFTDAAVFGAIVVLAVGLVGGGRRPSQSTVVVVIAIVFVLLVETVTMMESPAATLLFGRLALLGVLALLVVSGFSEREWRILAAALVGIGILEAGLGVLEFWVAHRPLPWGYKQDVHGAPVTLLNTLLPGHRYRVSGSLGHPIPFAMVLSAALVVVLSTARRRPRVRSLSVCLVLVVGLVLSGSRSALISVLIAGAYLLWTSASAGRAARVLVAVLVGAGTTILFAGELGRLADRLVNSGSFWNRTGSLAAVPRLLSRPPLETLFGSGYGSEMELYSAGYLQQNGFFVIDNQLVTSIATEGVVGAVLVITLIVVAYVRGGRTKRAMLLVFVTMMFSFDYFGWPTMFCLFLVTAALPPELGVGTASTDGLGLAHADPLRRNGR